MLLPFNFIIGRSIYYYDIQFIMIIKRQIPKMISTLSAYRDIILFSLKRIKVVLGIRINSADTRLKDSL